jgi:alkylation response protein AidB-like acyl-CoA dehydrogenase
MDFHWSPKQNAFRREVRAFLERELGAAPVGAGGESFIAIDEQWERAVAFSKKLAQRGWLAPAWPREYGGAGMGIMEQVIYNEEMAYHGAPIVNNPGVNMVGPTLIVAGSEEQKCEHLPRIMAVEEMWCQGYSEPSAGSDLASLQTRAVRDGDDFVLNGQKIWTTMGHRADWMVVLARTNPDAPKHRGISMLLLDMKSPGVSVRPLITMQDLRIVNEVFFENVRVSRRNLVGEENRGWYIGVTLLDFERSNVAGAARAKRSLDRLITYCRQGQFGSRLLDKPGVRPRLAELAIEIEVGRAISYRVASAQARGEIPSVAASTAKLYHSELGQRIANASLTIAGCHGTLMPTSAYPAPLDGRLPMNYMEAIPATIAAGSSEIQRNIIATRGLGLPRA